jgi:hypothetical protein
MPFGPNADEFFLVRQFFTPNYAQLAILIGLLLVVIYRPERIHRPGMFRLACVLLAVSILALPVTSAIATIWNMIYGNGLSGNRSDLVMLLSLLQVTEPILVAVSVCLVLFSLLPPSRPGSGPGPKQHPMEE